MFITFSEVILSLEPKYGLYSEVCQRQSDFPLSIGFHDLILCQYTQISPFSTRKNESHIVPMWEVIFLEPLSELERQPLLKAPGLMSESFLQVREVAAKGLREQDDQEKFK